MKKLLTFALTLALVSCLASCNNSNNESSKTAELEKRVAELESQISEQSTTTTTTTASTTNTTTTTVIQTSAEITKTDNISTEYTKWGEMRQYTTSIDLDLHVAPDKNSAVVCTIKPYTYLNICGEVNDNWLAVMFNDQVVFANRWILFETYEYPN